MSNQYLKILHPYYQIYYVYLTTITQVLIIKFQQTLPLCSNTNNNDNDFRDFIHNAI